jgi:hypothetical protein
VLVYTEPRSAFTVYPKPRGEPRSVDGQPRPRTVPFPFLPSSHPSLFFSSDCTLSSTTAISQPFANQSLPHTFHRDGGYTPLHSESYYSPVVNYLPKSFSCNTYGPSRKCCKHRTYGEPKSMLSLLAATLTKNKGWGAAFLRRSNVHTFNVFGAAGRRGHWELARGSSWCRFL